MEKISFNYTKPGEEAKTRNLLYPKYLKESSNYLKDITRDGVKYVQGYELDSSLSELQRVRFEEAIREYHERTQQSLSDYLEAEGLDSKKVVQKSFKTENISELKILTESAT